MSASSSYGIVEIETKGVEARKTDALECLLALCRVIGLYYEIRPSGPEIPSYPYFVRVTWKDWPVDFFIPWKREGGYSTHCSDPVDGLSSAIYSAVNGLQRNGESFRSGFLEYYRQITGRDWLKGEQGQMGTLTVPGPFYPVEIQCETGKVSDGYHTFDELYDHRCLLFCALTRELGYNMGPWKSRKHHDGSSFEGWFIAGLNLPDGQISYHLPDKYWDLCGGQERETGLEWDGHTSQNVVERLIAWLKK